MKVLSKLALSFDSFKKSFQSGSQLHLTMNLFLSRSLVTSVLQKPMGILGLIKLD